MILVEGPDASGKSTLIDQISEHIPWPVMRSFGPCHSKVDMDYRLRVYQDQVNSQGGRVIFDRVPYVSEILYKRHIQKKPSFVSAEQSNEWFKTHNPLVIYCHPIPGAVHQLKGYDDPGFLEKLIDGMDDLKQGYEEWAMRKAHIIYRIGDPVDRVVEMTGAYSQLLR